MTPEPILPFCYPASVFFVDDSRSFLQSLDLVLDKNLSRRFFSSASEALAALSEKSAQAVEVMDYFTPNQDADEASFTTHVLDFNTDLIRSEVYNEKRFARVSVAVVDYEMPEMSGLDLCKSISDPLVKKILLTGKADERLVVEAFNERLINRYIPKSAPDLANRLNAAIGVLQKQYFRESGRAISEVLAAGSHDFFIDPMFSLKFGEICQNLRIVEHYLCINPAGVLMLDIDAKPYLLLVQSEASLLSECEIALHNEAPAELLDALQSTRYIPYFWKTPGFHYERECSDWRNYLHPAKAFKGKKWYYCAVIENPDGFMLDTVLSYREFLRAQAALKFS